MASPARNASRVFALATSVRPFRQSASTASSSPSTSSITSISGNPSPPSRISTASARDSGSRVPGRAPSSCSRRSAAADSTRKPREPFASSGFMQTSRPG